MQILADAMGLGKTVMTISVIISNPGRGGVPTDPAVSGPPKSFEVSGSPVGKLSQVVDLKKKQIGPRKGGGTLIVCPMTLLGQWKVAITITFRGGLISLWCQRRNTPPDTELFSSFYAVRAIDSIFNLWCTGYCSQSSRLMWLETLFQFMLTMAMIASESVRRFWNTTLY